MSLEITNDNFSDVISNKVLVLDFWAPWCGPCKQYGPILDTFSDANSDITVGKVNVDENQTLAAKYGIRSIPTTVIFQNGQLITKFTGVTPQSKLEQLVEPLK
jgi:thioredoxin